MESVIQTNVSLKKEENVSSAPQENIKRSIVKTISWRVVGTLATVTISYLITGTLALAFSIGGIELVSKMILYFFHERAWTNIKWGK
ncbi:DUF2061 domain-containing protein [Winogradskyella sp. PC D3.3]